MLRLRLLHPLDALIRGSFRMRKLPLPQPLLPFSNQWTSFDLHNFHNPSSSRSVMDRSALM
uniref:Uncharacterized protein n=1 Tax=Arundo donax TaxID=35708 RepID=A0A0A9F471_ARUDO